MTVHIAPTVLLALLVGTKVTAAGNAKTEVPELSCYTFDGRYYLGRLSNTINGRTCQAWSDQTPHTHNRTKENYQYRGLEENYCRNPDGELKPWCYTTDKWKRWEYCQVPKCSDPVDGSTRDNPTMEKPTVKPEPTEEPTEEPEPTEKPTEEPTATEKPTEEPTEKPTEEPTEEPTEKPTEEPTATEKPTEKPEPTEEPTEEPTATEKPTEKPKPTEEPEPTEKPTKPPEEPKNTTVEQKPAEEPKNTTVEQKPAEEPKNTTVEQKPAEEPKNTTVEQKPAEEPKNTTVEQKPAEEPKNMTVEQKPAEEPKNITVADKILNKHNQLRRDVQPTARNMLKMSWNKDAAATAQRWANKCTMKHSPRKERRIGELQCGENLYMRTNFKTWDTAIDAWYREINGWEYGTGAINGSVVGHFTQIVWYRSNQLGCAMAHCPDAKYKYYYVCHYCPAGNVGGKRGMSEPYKLGPSCGDCPGAACDDNLCTNPCPYKDKYSNCPSLKESYTCGHSQVAAWCKASCRCTTEII